MLRFTVAVRNTYNDGLYAFFSKRGHALVSLPLTCETRGLVEKVITILHI